MMSSEDESTKLNGPPKNEVDGNELWSNELFGCFSDWRLCIATFCCPCYTAARNAEHFGEDGLVTGLLYCLIVGYSIGPVLRWRLRQEKSLKGNMITDVIVHTFLPCCALIQDNKEIYGATGAHIGEQVPLEIDIARK